MYRNRWVIGEQANDFRSFQPSPSNQPPPKVPPFFAPAEGPPQTEPPRKIEEQNRVCRRETDRKEIVRTEVSIHHPTRLVCQLLLNLHPLVFRQRYQARFPEMLIQLDNRKAKGFAEPASNGRFPSSTSTKDDDPLHAHILGSNRFRRN